LNYAIEIVFVFGEAYHPIGLFHCAREKLPAQKGPPSPYKESYEKITS